MISPYGYQAILQRIRQSKQPVSAPRISSSLSSTSSIDSKLKVKICRSQSSTNDWYIPQSISSIELPDLVNSCSNLTKYKKTSFKKRSSILNKPRRRIRFIPTMVKVPPSIFDYISNHQYKFETFHMNEMLVVNVEDNITDTSDIKQTHPSQKTICKVPPYIRDSGPLDLSLK